MASTMAAAVTLLAGVEPAQAQTTFHVAPAAIVGTTDNPSVAVVPGPSAGDIFAGTSVDSSVSNVGKRASHSLHLYLGYTHSLVSDTRDVLSASLSGSSSFVLTPDLDLGFVASGVFSRTGRVDLADLTVVNPQATIPGTTQFLNPMAGQSLSYRPTTRWRFSEGLTVAELVYVNSPVSLPDTTLFGAELRAERLYLRDGISLALSGADSVSGAAMTTLGLRPGGHTFLGEGLLGWRRDVTALWTSELDAGVLTLVRPDSRYVLAPAAVIALRYLSRPWFLTFTLSQTPVSNMFLGEATVNDQLLARAALPLDRPERLLLTGFASYIYARGATDVAAFARLYDQKNIGASLTYRPPKLPLSASATYTLVDQNGGMVGGLTASDLLIQTFTLSVAAVFAWGPGTPSLFNGLVTAAP